MKAEIPRDLMKYQNLCDSNSSVAKGSQRRSHNELSLKVLLKKYPSKQKANSNE